MGVDCRGVGAREISWDARQLDEGFRPCDAWDTRRTTQASNRYPEQSQWKALIGALHPWSCGRTLLLQAFTGIWTRVVLCRHAGISNRVGIGLCAGWAQSRESQAFMQAWMAGGPVDDPLAFGRSGRQTIHIHMEEGGGCGIVQVQPVLLKMTWLQVNKSSWSMASTMGRRWQKNSGQLILTQQIFEEIAFSSSGREWLQVSSSSRMTDISQF